MYGMLVVTVLGELLRDLRCLTTHQLLNIHRLQCTVYALFTCAVSWELFLHGWHVFTDRQLICLFALLHTSSLPPFWQHGRPCTLLFQSVFPLLHDTSGSSILDAESSQVSISVASPSKAARPDSTREAGTTTFHALPAEGQAADAASQAGEQQDIEPAGSPYAALRSVHCSLALWFIMVMALEVAWGVPAIMFWARSYRQACVEPSWEAGIACDAYAFFLFFRVRAYGWMRWLQLAWYSLEALKTVSLTARVCAVLGAVMRLSRGAAAAPSSFPMESADRASCSHGPQEAEAADAAAPLLPASQPPAAAASAPPLCGAARRWAKAQRGFAAALLRGGDAAGAGAQRMPREVTPRRMLLKALLGAAVLTMTVATVECNLWWNGVAGGPAGWDFGQTMAAMVAAAGVALLAFPGRDVMVSLVEDVYYGGEA